ARLCGRLGGWPGSRRAGGGAGETWAWMLRELRTAEGGLAASLDADSEGEEGKFYVWRPAELREVLGPEDGAFAAGVFGVTEAGTFGHGASVPHRRAEPGGPQPFAPGPGGGQAAGGGGGPGPPGRGGKGRRGLEGAGHLRAGGGRPAARPAGLHRGRGRRGKPAGPGAPDRRAAGPHLARRRGRRHRRS